jgi:Na+-driven multidrug efflux pump
LAFYGDSAIAGYTISIRIILFTLLPSWGISNAASTLVGQNIGAGKLKRATKSVWYTSYVNMAFLGLVAVILIAKAPFWVGIFSTDPAISNLAVLSLQILGAGFILYALGMVMLQALNGAGDTRSPTYINFIAFWLIEIPLAYYLAICLWKDELGVFLAIIISESLMTLMGVWVILRGRWKYRKV